MNLFEQQNAEFIGRHIGPNEAETKQMLSTIGEPSLESLVSKTVPTGIRMSKPLSIPPSMSEYEYLQHIKEISLKNKVYRTYIGQGYYDTITPSVILRNVFENPGWYTQYTPYQAEISQGRLESLLNFQTMVSDLTGLPIANASLLDEGSAAAEAMTMFFNALNRDHDHITRPKFFVDQHTFPQTLDVIITRATPVGIEVVTGDYRTAEIDNTYFGALVQYPNDKGSVEDYRQFINKVHTAEAYVVMATDLLALTLLTPPGELGADAACGSAQRFGVPLGFGGPHAAFFAVKDDFKRSIPGRIIGVSIDAQGNRALRMALQTREQHIKREKATSNICTAQALLANMAAMYAVFHGPEGLKNIAKRVTILANALSEELSADGYDVVHNSFFDTVVIKVKDAAAIRAKAEAAQINFRYYSNNEIGISVDETTSLSDVLDILLLLDQPNDHNVAGFSISDDASLYHLPSSLTRTSPFLTHPVFNTHHSETQMMRYIKYLENKDLSLNTSMISLGSCTMKLNAASEMIPLSWSHWAKMHPFAPVDQTQGYYQIVTELSDYLCKITAFDACSLQPNSGAQGEYAGLLVIREWHRSRGEGHRNVMLIPISAHGTNPASAVMAGMKVVVVKALENGYIDVEDLKAKANQYSKELAGIMITYPSTYGVYEETVKEITSIIHEHGGQVYMDGANMNAQVGLTAPGLIGADVCHLNLHKTFAIPHGGGGPGMGPICVKEHLAPFLPGHVTIENGKQATHAVSAAPFGSASILLISYAYIRMLGYTGTKAATEYAILNANYMRSRLQGEYEILYLGSNGTCAHEFIIDLRPFKKSAEIEAEDVAKRLMDYGFHAPTLSFPVPGTIMIEPTESEDKAELDRFCEAMLSIREEIRAIEEGKADKKDNPLKNAPHTQHVVISSDWNRSYSRETAAFPLPYVSESKFWPSVSRVNNTHGDRNLICTCEPVSSYAEAEAN
ncbi:aminomethyl-transferring glycine dehydrogenase [Pseudobacter ginsenosidimutans]|uniref:Glycine dehydrogenase (decarboxylating) n=1 Tax=Pseudobacter ginsenosidimutans TaxID=661488 RepID=A0A4Q7MAB6_9BACT|nr:aminomethyl-transferring glycine dehydrogenase [Pseudobacter ginsenosidimutans]QEC42719.1 aminomethyl-transferring glycine dehydrogenase [Pseudobacter ginsenosidimutans]RZS65125.1 glycine dehydrogenase (decarboxylating) alpha subunit /glycine dehydrogenase (decarboxylating) beta subunit [Pseudobacter ginsenosidimutans]